MIERFGAAGVSAEKIAFSRETFTFRAPGAPGTLLESFRAYYGPTMNAFEAAEKDGRAEALQGELNALFTSQNTSTTATSIPATYMRVTVNA